MSRHRGSAGSLTIGSLRGLPQAGVVARGAGTSRARPARGPIAASTALPVLDGSELPPSRRGQRCCRTGCAGCPVGEAIRRARARGSA